MKLTEGDTLKNFTLKDQLGNDRQFSEFFGGPAVFYFYPKDDTTGCTKEALGFKEHADRYKQQGISVIGLSPDSVASHKKYADKYNLPFVLLADEQKEVIESFGLWIKKKLYGREYMGTDRKTILTGKGGKILKIYHKVNVNTHATDILNDLSQLE